MNKVILVGRLARDPENRVSGNNLEITRFTLACNSEIVSRDGENNAEFINCVAFRNTASAINRFCTKGTSIAVIGKIHNGSYTAQDGTKRYTTEVTVDSFEFAGSSNRNQNSGINSYSNASNNSYSASNDYNSNNSFNEPVSEPSFINNNEVNDSYANLGDDITLSSDDLPF